MPETVIQDQGGPDGSVLAALARGAARDLRTLQVKLTHVGTQSKPVPSIAFCTFQHLMRMEWFTGLRRPGLHYDNDEIALWNFTVAPEEIERVVKSLHQKGLGREAGRGEEHHLSVMFALRESRLGDLHQEVVLPRAESAAVFASIRDALDPANGLARKVLQLRLEMSS